ncbi:MAG TPA: hypothetical protein VFQ53_04920 [Kofleriaceae bacterium]|nr:hypothetical protein [Kofleriaceae bacterium]
MTEHRLTPIELRLYAVTIVAIGYVIAWAAIGGGGRGEPAPPVARVAPAAPPSLAPPPGWRVVTSPMPTPAVTRAPATRPLRVRTRSS